MVDFRLVLVLASLFSGCTPHITPPSAVEHLQTPAGFPSTYYQQAKATGSTVLKIDAKHSLVVIDVRRGGVLARLGHDHVVASHDVTGYVDITGGRADLYVPLDHLTVDETALRAEAGLTTQPSQDAIDGTRHNMLVKVLEADQFPFALIRIIRDPADRLKLSVAITLHGTTKTFDVPAQIDTTPGVLKISGKMTFNQSDFGITPFSILGGAMLVEDKLDLRFQIFAGEI